MVRALIELGADVMAADKDGITPVDIAKTKGHAACVAVLEQALLNNVRHSLPTHSLSSLRTT